ncbi:DMT family transporter [Thalassotalea marina]|uniref:DMT family transporter n=1 Tax=Thalassotalea marina TaxID=1673741 RepID=A0A919ELS6_9GAMM|nr:DMT family transporter [Thalassotalea marina]GHF96224.1 hypothetical protein GCM10017161_25720 [Thalassotalea marina]
MNAFAFLALFAGAAIAVQAALNTKLGVITNNTFFATSVAFLVAFITTCAAFLIFMNGLPNVNTLRSVPVYMWFTGGMISALGVGLFYFLIPKMGVGQMMSFALTGQLITAMIISHQGWLNLPEKPIEIQSIIGAILMIFGVILVNWSKSHAA